MQIPIQHIIGNIAWTTTGQVWGLWRVTPSPYLHASPRARAELHAQTTNLLKHLSGEPMLLSLCAQTAAADVAEAMVEGVDLDAHPEWAEVTEATLDWLDDIALTERTHWLALPLPADRPALELRSLATAAASTLAALLGVRPQAPSSVQVRSYLTKADRLNRQMTGQPVIRPATPAEIMWVLAHSVRRGIAEPLLADTVHADRHLGASRLWRGRLRGPSLAGLGQVRLVEGGKPDGTRRVSLRRRWLQVETAQGTSYQAFLGLVEMPATFVFPGSEWLASIDRFPMPVDWCSRLRIVSNAEADAKTKRKARELSAQVEEYDGDTSGPPQTLFDAAADLDDERTRLQGSRTEVEIQSATVLCVWGESPEEVDRYAELLHHSLSAAEYQLMRPVGGQRALWASMLPGAPVPSVLAECTQFQLASDYAMAMPWASTEVGDPTGSLLGISLDGGTARPVLVDLARAPRQDASASLGVVGELGAGKSVLLKALQIGLVDRGDRVIAIDRTPLGEWARFAAEAAPDRHQIIRADAEGSICLDPLRVFDGAVGARYAKSYLTLQLGVPAMSTGGLALAQAVDAVAASPEPHMGAVITELEQIADEEEGHTDRAEKARELAGLLDAVAQDRLGRLVFGDLPPLRLDDDSAAFTVFHTSGLTLPTREVFTSEWHMQRQPLETLIGRAVLYLVAAVAREMAFTDTRFTAIALDECHWLTNSTEGSDLVLELVRDGRKHAAGAMLGSHDPTDFGDEIVQGLLATKVVLRHRDVTLARKALSFLGLDPDDQAMVDLVTTDLSPTGDPTRKGEALLADTRRRIGRIQVLIPPMERIQTSILTTPST